MNPYNAPYCETNLQLLARAKYIIDTTFYYSLKICIVLVKYINVV